LRGSPGARLSSLVLLSSLVALPSSLVAQRGASALGEEIAALGTTARVLMIGAHPDDEDTQLLTFLAKGRHIETAYLSLTRGDGGQNLIGNELGQALGMIRTEELLAARRMDGAHQYFSRAYDFGFTKTLDETLKRWPRDSVLKDVVAIVRAFKPHVIIAVFSGTPADGHGQHQYSGVIAREVFDAAADSVRFPPRVVAGLAPWTVSKFYRLRRNGGGSLNFNVGEYDPLIGASYSEIASVSRSQHRSQGQGELIRRGPRFSGVQLEVSRESEIGPTETSLFNGMDTSWARFKSPMVDSLTSAAAAVRAVEDLAHPSRMAPALANFLGLVIRASSTARDADLIASLATTRARAERALLDAAGVVVEATAPRELIAERDTMTAVVSVYNHGMTPVILESAALSNGASSRQSRTIPPDSVLRQPLLFQAVGSATIPWWLMAPMQHGADMFVQPMAEMIAGEDRLQTSGADVVFRIEGVSVRANTGPIVYLRLDPSIGELRRPVATVPQIAVLLEHEVEYARANAAFDRMMVVHVHSAATTARDVAVALTLPAGLTADSAVRHATIPAFGDANLYFRVKGRLAPGRQLIRAAASVNGAVFESGFVPVEYPHIRPLRFYRPAMTQVEAVKVTLARANVGYVRGVGDNVMPMLQELGIPVTELDPLTLPQADLSGFSAIVIGPRAYEANPALVANNAAVLNFARRGGTVVVQYGQAPYARLGVLPYPVTFAAPADRVTDESAPVRVIDPGSALLAAPNRITDSDFADWVQERTLYMPRTFDPRYRAVFSMNDPGEPPNDAAVLVAPLGKGAYVYTTFSFFRQLPAGNPGAARLFVNLISAKSKPVRP
jgi:LmbE family N-acetylglucosaminyl deacetylase